MTNKQTDLFRSLIIKALFLNDFLADKLTLKGGSALDLVYNLTGRSSLDIDVALAEDFSSSDLFEIEGTLLKTLNDLFNEENYTVFDLTFTKRPKIESNPRWGGYLAEFKIMEGIYSEEEISKNLEKYRRCNSIPIGSSRKFKIDISKYEATHNATNSNYDGIEINVYSLEMIVYEKIRAICQQLPEYKYNMGHFKKSRLKDFYDIYKIVKNNHINRNRLNLRDLTEFFDAKEVPLELLNQISKYKEHFKEGESQLLETLRKEESTNYNFNTIFDYVVNLIAEINHQ